MPRKKTLAPPDALELIGDDHRKIRSLFKRVLATSPRAQKTRYRLFETLYDTLDAHDHIEANIFYPAVQETVPDTEMVAHAYAEHAEIKNELRALWDEEKKTKQWIERLRQLQGDVEHHMKEEETGMLKRAKEMFSPERLGHLGKRMWEEKARLMHFAQ